MRRADRLFQIVQILRRRRLTTARQLAEELEVSERTVYRDIRDLCTSGVPIQGEAGVGYAMPKGFDLPPLMFTAEEIEALVLGARVVKSFGDPALARAAEDVLSKVESVLPHRLKPLLASSALFALSFDERSQVTADLGVLRGAIRGRHKVRFSYVRADGTASQRRVRPLCLSFVAPRWWLSAWCELRQEFRTFRLDRLSDLEKLDETFPVEVGRELDDFLKVVTRES